MSPARRGPVVRRVRVEDWRSIRDLRVEAVSDPDAAIAFRSTPTQERAHDDAFWRGRAAGSALGTDAAQFIADDRGRWVGTATALLRGAESPSPGGAGLHAEVVGVYVSPDHRGTGVLAQMIDAVVAWAADHGALFLTLNTHIENLRAQAAYRKVGFVPTGERMTTVIGPELVMRREVA